MKVTKSLKDKDIVIVTFDKDTEEFRLIKRQSYQKRLAEFFSCSSSKKLLMRGITLL